MLVRDTSFKCFSRISYVVPALARIQQTQMMNDIEGRVTQDDTLLVMHAQWVHGGKRFCANTFHFFAHCKKVFFAE